MARLAELFVSGGPVMFFIAVVSILAWYLAVRTWVQTVSILKRVRQISILPLHIPPSRSSTGSAHRLSGFLPGFGNYQLFSLALESQTARLKSSLWLVGTLALILPLLGLLGTVLGMLVSFEVIQVHGTGQPRLLAGGISQALITTQAGLWTAVPVLFFHHITSSRVRLIRNEMEVLSHVMQTRVADGGADWIMKDHIQSSSDQGQATHDGDS